jgi:hypothetical protein
MTAPGCLTKRFISLGNSARRAVMTWEFPVLATGDVVARTKMKSAVRHYNTTTSPTVQSRCRDAVKIDRNRRATLTRCRCVGGACQSMRSQFACLVPKTMPVGTVPTFDGPIDNGKLGRLRGILGFHRESRIELWTRFTWLGQLPMARPVPSQHFSDVLWVKSRDGRPTRGTYAFYRKPEIRVSRKSVCGAVAVEGFC